MNKLDQLKAQTSNLENNIEPDYSYFQIKQERLILYAADKQDGLQMLQDETDSEKDSTNSAYNIQEIDQDKDNGMVQNNETTQSVPLNQELFQKSNMVVPKNRSTTPIILVNIGDQLDVAGKEIVEDSTHDEIENWKCKTETSMFKRFFSLTPEKDKNTKRALLKDVVEREVENLDGDLSNRNKKLKKSPLNHCDSNQENVNNDNLGKFKKRRKRNLLKQKTSNILTGIGKTKVKNKSQFSQSVESFDKFQEEIMKQFNNTISYENNYSSTEDLFRDVMLDENRAQSRSNNVANSLNRKRLTKQVRQDNKRQLIQNGKKISDDYLRQQINRVTPLELRVVLHDCAKISEVNLSVSRTTQDKHYQQDTFCNSNQENVNNNNLPKQLVTDVSKREKTLPNILTGISKTKVKNKIQFGQSVEHFDKFQEKIMKQLNNTICCENNCSSTEDLYSDVPLMFDEDRAQSRSNNVANWLNRKKLTKQVRENNKRRLMQNRKKISDDYLRQQIKRFTPRESKVVLHDCAKIKIKKKKIPKQLVIDVSKREKTLPNILTGISKTKVKNKIQSVEHFDKFQEKIMEKFNNTISYENNYSSTEDLFTDVMLDENRAQSCSNNVANSRNRKRLMKQVRQDNKRRLIQNRKKISDDSLKQQIKRFTPLELRVVLSDCTKIREDNLSVLTTTEEDDEDSIMGSLILQKSESDYKDFHNKLLLGKDYEVWAQHRNGNFYRGKVTAVNTITYYSVYFPFHDTFCNNLKTADVVDWKMENILSTGQDILVKWIDGVVHPANYMGKSEKIVYKILFEDLSELELSRDMIYDLREKLPKRIKSKLVRNLNIY